MSRHVSRRRFLQAASFLSASAAGLPAWFVEESLSYGQDAKPTTSPNDRPRVALIGCGGRGMPLSKEAKPFADVVAVCDVDEKHVANGAYEHKGAAEYRDFRKAIAHKGLDAVLCATPDHWHTLVNLHAMRQGKDVYSEKPLTLTIDEGKHVVRTAGRPAGSCRPAASSGRTPLPPRVRAGPQRAGSASCKQVMVAVRPGRGPKSAGRSRPPRCRRNWTGRCGRARRRRSNTCRSGATSHSATGTTTPAARSPTGGRTTTTSPSGAWARSGAGRRPSRPSRSARWCRAATRPSPTTASSIRGRTASSTSATASATTTAPAARFPTAPGETHHGVKFIGSDGWIYVTRGKIEASDPDLLKQELPASAERLYVSRNHMGDFIEGHADPQAPHRRGRIGHRSVSVCHLGNIDLASAASSRAIPRRKRSLATMRPSDSLPGQLAASHGPTTRYEPRRPACPFHLRWL